jgi:hypothetical protein
VGDHNTLQSLLQPHRYKCTETFRTHCIDLIQLYWSKKRIISRFREGLLGRKVCVQIQWTFCSCPVCVSTFIAAGMKSVCHKANCTTTCIVLLLQFSSVVSQKTPGKGRVKGKCKAIPLQAWTGWGSQISDRHMKVVSLSTLRTGRLYPPGIIPVTHFCYRLSQPLGHSAAGRMSLENSSDTIGNRTHDLPACSTVPQPNAPSERTCSWANSPRYALGKH